MSTIQTILKLEKEFDTNEEVKKHLSILQNLLSEHIDQLDDTEETEQAWDEFHEGGMGLDLDEISLFRFLLHQ